ncbi:MAG: DUF932 domain-containing protein [Armatimonadota bacterium]
MATLTAARPVAELRPPMRLIMPSPLPSPPATSWNGQTVLTARDQLMALRHRLPTFHREPFVVNGIENPHADVIVEDGSAYPITTVSKGYGLVQHAAVFDRAMDGLAALGFDVHGLHAEMTLTAHGERLKISVIIPGYDFDPGDGCPLVLRMHLLNSVDKTTAVAIELEWLRLVCGNGMLSGIGSAGFRKAHFRGIDDEAIAGELAASLQHVPQDRQQLQHWLHLAINRTQILPWIDHQVAGLWGEPTAARIWHILCHGEDARPEIIRGKEGEAPPQQLAHERPVMSLGPIPGAFAPVDNAYHVAQALSWVAKEQRNMGTRLRRIKEIPSLMQQLLAN